MSLTWMPFDHHQNTSMFDYAAAGGGTGTDIVGGGNFQCAPLYAPESLDEIAAQRPRLHTWPTTHLPNNAYASSNSFNEDTQPALDNLPESPRSEPAAGQEKRHSTRRNCGDAASTKTSHQSSGKSQQPRRKLTTHKLSAKSYVDLITEAIMSTSEKRMTLADIYKWMVANVPCFKEQAAVSASSGWKNAVRHTLSLHKRFKRIQRGRLQKPAWWTIQEAEYGHESIPAPVAHAAKRSQEVTSPRRHSEGSNLISEAFQPAIPYSSSMSSVFPSLVNEWPVVTEPCNTSMTATNIDAYTADPGPWLAPAKDAANQFFLTSAMGNLKPIKSDQIDTELEAPYMGNGENFNGIINGRASAASSPSSYTSFATMNPDYNKEYGSFLSAGNSNMSGFLYENEVAAMYEQQNDLQSVFVRTETGQMAHVNVPMPLRVDVRRQYNQEAQTVHYANGFFAKQLAPHFGIPRGMDGDPALPQDLLTVQVDNQVQCNVAEVLAYEMRASVDAGENNGVSELYDLLKAGCALD